jgi:Ca2+-binding RTX toxin-like protein
VASVSVFDKTTGVSTTANMDPYTGPITYLQDQYINITPDNIAVSTQAPNVFLRSGSGEDALQVSSGQNVIDSGTGSNLLLGGTGTDSFFTDARGGGVTWDTLVNFHGADSVTIWGWVPGVSRILSEVPGEGTMGYTGATLHMALDGSNNTDASLTFAGLTLDQVNSYLGNSSTGVSQGNPYLFITPPQNPAQSGGLAQFSGNGGDAFGSNGGGH